MDTNCCYTQYGSYRYNIYNCSDEFYSCKIAPYCYNNEFYSCGIPFCYRRAAVIAAEFVEAVAERNTIAVKMPLAVEEIIFSVVEMSATIHFPAKFHHLY
ncbi:hypothetical protein FLA_3949 [Filimonas lacunae]|nr:hypothetical protein FLA_3949 [Filimonas lacunae]